MFSFAPLKSENSFFLFLVAVRKNFLFNWPVLTLEQLAELFEKNRAAASARVTEFSIGGRQFNFNSEPAVMGVVNLSADSWYRESVCLSAESAIERGEVLHAQGADIVDVGAESTLANAARANDQLQKSKLIPVIQALRAKNILVSVETYSAAVVAGQPGGRREYIEFDRQRQFEGDFQNGRRA